MLPAAALFHADPQSPRGSNAVQHFQLDDSPLHGQSCALARGPATTQGVLAAPHAISQVTRHDSQLLCSGKRTCIINGTTVASRYCRTGMARVSTCACTPAAAVSAACAACGKQRSCHEFAADWKQNNLWSANYDAGRKRERAIALVYRCLLHLCALKQPVSSGHKCQQASALSASLSLSWFRHKHV